MRTDKPRRKVRRSDLVIARGEIAAEGEPSSVAAKNFVISPQNREALQAIRQALARDAFALCFGDSMRSASGKVLHWYLNVRDLLLQPNFLHKVAALFWESMQDKWPFQLCGVELASVPLMTAIALEGARHGKSPNILIVRKERKHYGLARQIEGRVQPVPVVLVDDIFNSGGSFEKVRVALAETNAPIAHAFVIVDFETKRGRAWLARHRIPITALTALRNLNLKLPRQADRPEWVDHFERTWSFSVPAPDRFHIVPKSAPVVSEGLVYFGADSGIFYALDAASGQVRWSHSLRTKSRKGIWSTPAVHAGRVYFGAYDGCVYCLDAATGGEIWQAGVADWVGSSPCLNVERDVLYIGLEFAAEAQRGAMAALSMSDGEKVWEFPLSTMQHGTATHHAGSGLVLFGSADGQVYALHEASGSLVWHADAESAVRGAICVADELQLAVFGTAGGDVLAVNLQDGAKRFKWQTGGEVRSAPLLVGATCFVASADKHLHVYDLERGAKRTAIELGGRLLASPSLAGESVFVATTGGLVVEIDPVALQPVGALQLPAPITAPITLVPGTDSHLAMSNAGELFAFRRTANLMGAADQAKLDAENDIRLVGNLAGIEALHDEISSRAPSPWLGQTGASCVAAFDGADAGELVASSIIKPLLQNISGNLGGTLERAAILHSSRWPLSPAVRSACSPFAT